MEKTLRKNFIIFYMEKTLRKFFEVFIWKKDLENFLIKKENNK
jgi:hypothetical protein